jgi:RNA polymerase sigma-70 factor (sigma-E family)
MAEGTTLNPMRPTASSDDFSAYVAVRWQRLLRTSYLLAGDRHAAEDLLQTTLVKAYVQWDRVRRADSPDAYVRRMLLNELLAGKRRDERRRGKVHLALTPEPAPAPTDGRVDGLDLWDHLQTLPPRQRAVVVLRYYEDLSEAEIASVLNISPGTVKSQASAALRSLRSTYDRQEGPR